MRPVSAPILGTTTGLVGLVSMAQGEHPHVLPENQLTSITNPWHSYAGALEISSPRAGSVLNLTHARSHPSSPFLITWTDTHTSTAGNVDDTIPDPKRHPNADTDTNADADILLTISLLNNHTNLVRPLAHNASAAAGSYEVSLSRLVGVMDAAGYVSPYEGVGFQVGLGPQEPGNGGDGVRALSGEFEIVG